MNRSQQLQKRLFLVLMLITLGMAACAPTTGDSLPPTAGNDGGVDDTADAVVEEVETAVPPTTVPESPTEPEEPDLVLHDMIWLLQSYAGQSVIDGSGVKVTFNTDGQLSGSAGCNSFFGSYRLDGTSLTINGVGSTEMWCEGLMDQESAFLNMLMNATDVNMDGNVLTIETSEGDLVFVNDDGVANGLTVDESTAVEITPKDEVIVAPENEDVIPGRYIVMLDPGLFNDAGETVDGKTLTVMADELTALTEGQLVSVLDIINGFVIEGLSKDGVTRLAKNPLVRSIEPDRLIPLDPND